MELKKEVKKGRYSYKSVLFEISDNTDFFDIKWVFDRYPELKNIFVNDTDSKGLDNGSEGEDEFREGSSE